MATKHALKKDVYEASDYAGLQVGHFDFYYGYECTEADDEEDVESPWCFRARIAGREIILTQSDIGASSQWDCAENLLKGIATLLERGDLTARASIPTPEDTQV